MNEVVHAVREQQKLTAPQVNLSRFIDAQTRVYPQVLAELSAGAKETSWMWFVFPQIAGLGRSAKATWFAIPTLAEARAYLAHEVLGMRLRECTKLVMATKGKSAFQIFNTPDDLKFRSCMTLFAHAAPDDVLFPAALVKFYAGQSDPKTLEILARKWK